MKYVCRTVSIATALWLASALLQPGSPSAAQAAGIKRIVHDPADSSPCPGKTDDTIATAVAAIPSGGSGTITVCPGTYAEAVHFTGVGAVKLIGKPGAMIVPMANDFDGPMIRVENSTNVTVQGFILDGMNHLEGSGGGIGIQYDHSAGVITKNFLTRIRKISAGPCWVDGTTDTGIRVIDAPAPVKVSQNTVFDFGCTGIYVANSPKVSVQKNLLWTTVRYVNAEPTGILLTTSNSSSITSNSISGDWLPAELDGTMAIDVFESSSVKISGNQINHFRYGIYVKTNRTTQDSDNLTISANRINNVRYGVYIDVLAVAGNAPSSDNDKITGNTFYSPNLYHAPDVTTWDAIYLWAHGTGTPSLTNTTVKGNKQYGFTLMLDDQSGGDTHESGNKTIPPPTGF